MNTFYTDERNIQILIYLLKKHNVKRIIASPGTTNLTFVASIQQDPFFEIYSVVDERSAAYIACGMAAESGEPVVLTCTGATASRNYLSGLTEAFYRKLPVLAVTSMQHPGRIGQNMPQVIDRREQLNDIAKISVQIPTVVSSEDEWACAININKAILELTRNGGGPAHINIATSYSRNFNVKNLPEAQFIKRINYGDDFPEIFATNIIIFVGSHKPWSDRLTKAVDKFCEIYNAVVLCDHTSNYKGKYRVVGSIVTGQSEYYSKCRKTDLLIHIGDVSGAEIGIKASESFRVNPDGEIRDTFRSLSNVFQMEESYFFEQYIRLYDEKNKDHKENTYYLEWQEEINKLYDKMPELPFSAVWIAKNTAHQLPENSTAHFGILNSLRSWNFFEIPKSVTEFSNVGGFGIDGNLSSLIGASLVNPQKLYFGVVGDLAFFYDLNSIGNRHVGSNIRIMLVNNGRGTEFRNYNHMGALFGEDADNYIAAAGHFGNKSDTLVKNYAESLGFKYLTASNKEEYLEYVDEFLNGKSDKPILFEIFTDSENESRAIKLMHEIETRKSDVAISFAKKTVKKFVSDSGVEKIKKIIKY